MFTLPSMWNLVVSTIVFFIAAFYVKRFLEEQGIPQGTTRSLVVFMLAYLLSWGAGELADWADATLESAPPIDRQADTATTAKDLSSLIKP